MEAIFTICSKRKNHDEELMPARTRYTGDHVKTVANIADESKLPFFILSGKYGLISSDEKIPDYDYYLEYQAVDSLVKKVVKQIKESGITELVFYAEPKEGWKPYESVLQKAAKITGVTLRKVLI